MSHSNSYKVQSLYFFSNGDVKAPIVQGLFARKIADHIGLNCQHLARITFNRQEMHMPLNEEHRADVETLLIADGFPGELIVYLWIRIGKSGIPIAKLTEGNPTPYIFKEYKEALLLNKLNQVEIAEIGFFVFNEPDILNVVPRRSENQ